MVNNRDFFFVVSDDDGRWFVVDESQMVITHDHPFYSRETAEQRRDDLNLKMWEILGV